MAETIGRRTAVTGVTMANADIGTGRGTIAHSAFVTTAANVVTAGTVGTDGMVVGTASLGRVTIQGIFGKMATVTPRRSLSSDPAKSLSASTA